MFANRQDAGSQLAERLRHRDFYDLLVLGVPRGGVVVGAELARELDGELDVVLSRKLRSPDQMELAIGAISETGHVYLNPDLEELLLCHEGYLSRERQHQLAEIAWRKRLYREGRPPAEVAGRSVIVTDDGIATGSTMIAALQTIREQSPREIVVAVPVAPPDRLHDLSSWCNEVVCLQTPASFLAVGQFYEDFAAVDDEQVMALLRIYAGRHDRPAQSPMS